MSSNNNPPNTLIHEKSPYLLQHAFTPFHWLPWSEKAFDKAKSENRPLFIIIGHSIITVPYPKITTQKKSR